MDAIRHGVNTCSTIARDARVSKGAPTVNVQLETLQNMGFIEKAEDASEEKDLLRSNRSLKVRGKPIPYKLTAKGKITIGFIEQYKMSGSQEALEQIAAMVDDRPLIDADRAHLNDLVHRILSAYDADVDTQDLLRQLFNEIERLTRLHVNRWYEDVGSDGNSDVAKFILSVPELDLRGGSRTLGLRLIGRYIRSSNGAIEPDLGEGGLFDKLRQIALADTREHGAEAFDAIAEYRTKSGEIPDEVFSLYLAILWITADEGHQSSLADAEKQVRVLSRWKDALSTEQKKALVRAGTFLQLNEVDQFINYALGKNDQQAPGTRRVNESLAKAYRYEMSRLGWL